MRHTGWGGCYDGVVPKILLKYANQRNQSRNLVVKKNKKNFYNLLVNYFSIMKLSKFFHLCQSKDWWALREIMFKGKGRV